MTGTKPIRVISGSSPNSSLGPSSRIRSRSTSSRRRSATATDTAAPNEWPRNSASVHVDPLQRLGHGRGLALERVVAERLCRSAVAEQVDSHHAVVGGQQRREPVEPVHRAGEAVQQHRGWRGAVALVEHVEIALACGHQAARPGARRTRLAPDQRAG